METILLFAPLVGAIICGFSWRLIGEQAACVVATGLLFLSMLLSWVVFLGFDGETYTRSLFTWIESGTLFTDWAIRVDRLTAIMLIVITSVSALVHLYSFGYMAHDDNFKEGESYRPRFFAYLSFFTFAMLMLVTADNLLQLFFGWEGVGVASYLLIGFYYRKPSAGAAAMKAFIVNRVGDFGFLLGIFALFWMADSIQFDVILADGPRADGDDVPLPRLRGERGQHDRDAAVHRRDGEIGAASAAHLAAGRDGGPDAGLGADPRRDHGDGGRLPRLPHVADHGIRALRDELHHHHRRADGLLRGDGGPRAERHQARDRLFDLFAAGLHVRGGGRRRLLGRDVPPLHPRLLQGDAVPRRRLGHPRDAPRAGHAELRRPEEEDPLHLLGDDDRDARHHRRRHPATYIGFAGFFSKDAVVESAFAFGGDLGSFAFWALIIAAVFTSFYSWRLMFLTFFGEARGNRHTHDHAHESPMTMLVPLGVLALGAVFSGVVWYNSFFGKTDQVATFFGVEYVDTMAEGGHGEDAAHGEEAATDTHGEEAAADTHGDAADAHGAADAGGHGSDHHYVFTSPPGEGAIHAPPTTTS
jgi:hypothetical protein